MKKLKSAVLAGGLSIVFLSNAPAYEPEHDHTAPPSPTLPPMTYDLQGCTADKVLMKARLSFKIDLDYFMSHLETPKKHSAVIEKADKYIREEAGPMWEEMLATMEWNKISKGQESPLRDLLKALYIFVEETYDTSARTPGNAKIYPVILSGSAHFNHGMCLKR